jgi:hypothetical protein
LQAAPIIRCGSGIAWQDEGSEEEIIPLLLADVMAAPVAQRGKMLTFHGFVLGMFEPWPYYHTQVRQYLYTITIT